MQNQKPSKPQDVAAVLVEIEWEGKEQPPKWETMLKKALQTFFNKNLKGIEVCNLDILDAPFSAKIIISPSYGKKRCSCPLVLYSEYVIGLLS